MSETKWTSPPWTAEQKMRGDGIPVLGWDIYGGIDGEEVEWIGEIVCKDDAHLTAAAPDLYDALAVARTYLGMSLSPPHPVLMACDAALALARGEKP